MSNASKVRAAALALSEAERISLSHELLSSVSHPVDDQWLEAWGAEVARRVTTFDRTSAKPVEEVLSTVRANLRK